MDELFFLNKYKFQIGITTVLVVLLAVFMVTGPRTFLSSRIYISFMSTIPFTALVALGLTLLIVAGELDLSFPSAMAMAGLVFTSTLTATDQPLLALGAALGTGALIGLLNGLLVVVVGVPSIIATIGTQFLWRGAATLLSDGLARNIVQVRGTFFHEAMVGRLGGVVPAQTLWCLLAAVACWVLLNRHTFGDGVRFIGDNIQTARMMGVPVRRIRILLFVQMGLLAAASSVLVCLEMVNWWPTQGEGYLLLVFASIFVGGTSVFGGEGTIYGTMVGAVVIGIVEAGIISAGLSGFWTRLIYGLIIVTSVSIYAMILKTKRE